MALTVILIITIFLIGLKISTSAKQVTVKSGDTVSSIAKINQLPINRIIKLNNLKNNGNDLKIGQTLKLSNDKKKSKKQKVRKPRKQVTQQAVNQSNSQDEIAQQSELSNTNETSMTNDNEGQAKEWIATRESSNSYAAQNGRYVGKYQLDASYLNGDYSPANQENVANNYVISRYGSWVNAQNFWISNGWY